MTKIAVPKKRPTQADVARQAGVSQATVSHVLNNSTVISLPDETRQRILDAMRDLGYVPDRNARSLRTRKTLTIASIIPDITNPFYPALQRGIQDVAEQHGYDLIMYNTDGIAEKERKCLLSVQHGRVDGVIAVLFHATDEELQPLIEQDIAVVSIAQKAPSQLPVDAVFVDGTAGAHTGTTYLIERGHKRISMITGPFDNPVSVSRVAGYQQAFHDHQLPFDSQLVQYSDFTETGGLTAMQRLLQRNVRPDAVFAANDLLAIGAMRAIREAGLDIPADIAIVGFDDIPAASLVHPQLTTIAQFQERFGQRAAEMLLERLSGKAPAHGRVEELPYALIIRETA